MATTDRRIDAYINRSADFAQPILKRVRKVVHSACPDVEETLKWGMPTFMYEGMLCGMAAFKQHAVFGFWKQSLMADPNKLFGKSQDAMGSLGCLTNVSDLPSDRVLARYIKEAMRLNEEGIKVQKKRPTVPRRPLRPPKDFTMVLARNKRAKSTFDDLSYSHKKEYLEWITEAKRKETRAKRIETAIRWLAEGKARNWQYMKK